MADQNLTLTENQWQVLHEVMQKIWETMNGIRTMPPDFPKSVIEALDENIRIMYFDLLRLYDITDALEKAALQPGFRGIFKDLADLATLPIGSLRNRDYIYMTTPVPPQATKNVWIWDMALQQWVDTGNPIPGELIMPSDIVPLADKIQGSKGSILNYALADHIHPFSPELNKVLQDIENIIIAVNKRYIKPTTGIPFNDLDQSVQQLITIGNQGSLFFPILEDTSAAPIGARVSDFILNSGTASKLVGNISMAIGDIAQILALSPFILVFHGNIRGPAGINGDSIALIPDYKDRTLVSSGSAESTGNEVSHSYTAKENGNLSVVISVSTPHDDVRFYYTIRVDGHTIYNDVATEATRTAFGPIPVKEGAVITLYGQVLTGANTFNFSVYKIETAYDVKLPSAEVLAAVAFPDYARRENINRISTIPSNADYAEWTVLEDGYVTCQLVIKTTGNLTAGATPQLIILSGGKYILFGVTDGAFFNIGEWRLVGGMAKVRKGDVVRITLGNPSPRSSITVDSCNCYFIPLAIQTYKLSRKDRKSATVIVGTTAMGHTEADVDFLCTGDNDDVVIQQAMDALPSSPIAGGKVSLREGIYYLNKPIQITKHSVHLEGMSWSTRFLLKSGVYLSSFIEVNASNVIISDILMRGDAHFGIDLSAGSVSHLTLRNVYMDIGYTTANTFGDNAYGVYMPDNITYQFILLDACKIYCANNKPLYNTYDVRISNNAADVSINKCVLSSSSFAFWIYGSPYRCSIVDNIAVGIKGIVTIDGAVPYPPLNGVPQISINPLGTNGVYAFNKF